MKALILSVFVLKLMTAPAFAQSTIEVMEEAMKPVKVLYDAVDAIAASDLSCDSNADCASLPSGSRACGGPQRYVIYSKKNPLVKELTFLNGQSTNRESEINRTYGIASICMMEARPAVACVANRCVKNAEDLESGDLTDW